MRDRIFRSASGGRSDSESSVGCNGSVWRGGLAAGQTKDEALEDETFVGGAGTELGVSAGDQLEATRKVAAVAVAAGLRDEGVGGEGGDAEAGPERLPDGALVANLFFVEYKHLAEGFGEREDVTDRRIVPALAGVEQAVKECNGAGCVFEADRVGEFVEAALLGGRDHRFNVDELDGRGVLRLRVEHEFGKFAGECEHLGAERIDEF